MATAADISLTTNAPVLVAIIAAAAAVGSGLVAGLVALINVGRSNRNEHLKWQRERRLEAYSAFLGTVTNAFSAIKYNRPGADFETLRNAYNSGSAALVVLGPSDLKTLVDGLGQKMRDWRDDPADQTRMNAVNDDLERLANRAAKVLQPHPPLWNIKMWGKWS